jgi:3-hydroxybutyryl-CoA dehydratase
MDGRCIEDLKVGDSASFSKTVTAADIDLFAQVTGDTNPVHLDEAYAAKTMFKGRIAHGMLSAGFISTVLGTKVPGPGAIYLKQELSFRAPVKIGDTVTATVTVTEVMAEKKRAAFKTVVTVGDTVVVDGAALMLVPSRAGK